MIFFFPSLTRKPINSNYPSGKSFIHLVFGGPNSWGFLILNHEIIKEILENKRKKTTTSSLLRLDWTKLFLAPEPKDRTTFSLPQAPSPPPSCWAGCLAGSGAGRLHGDGAWLSHTYGTCAARTWFSVASYILLRSVFWMMQLLSVFTSRCLGVCLRKKYSSKRYAI